MKTVIRAGLSLMLAVGISLPILAPTPAAAQAAPASSMPGMGGMTPSQTTTPPAPAAVPGKRSIRLPNTPPGKNWPSPVVDQETNSFLLFSLLELQHGRGSNPTEVRWDIVGWRGGDVNRIWFKSEGNQPALARSTGNSDVQVLYGKLVSPFFDFQTGVRVEQRNFGGRNSARASAVVTLQGLAPNNFNIEPSIFLYQDGQIAGRFTGTYDLYLSQRLILQPRLETEVALQNREKLGSGSGLNDVELGLRLRYEIRREFAPYIGISSTRSYGVTAGYLRRGGEATSKATLVAGVQMWF
jgi:copper resistance protein B